MTIRRFAPNRPLAVIADAPRGAPARIRWRGRWDRVVAIAATWEQTDAWWAAAATPDRAPDPVARPHISPRGDTPATADRRPPTADYTHRRYYRLRTGSGLLCVIYRDLPADRWYLEQFID